MKQPRSSDSGSRRTAVGEEFRASACSGRAQGGSVSRTIALHA